MNESFRGFPRLAHKIAHDADKTNMIYRRFDRSASRNLLLLEAEIAELEARQDELDEEDHNEIHSEFLIKSRSNWKTFELAAKDKTNPRHVKEAERMKLAMTIRERLREYCKWCLSFSTTSQMTLTNSPQMKLWLFTSHYLTRRNQHRRQLEP